MHQLKACGVLCFRSRPECSFLLLRHRNRFDFPKGHLEGDETELACALRELHEETGIRADDIRLVPDFRYEVVYYPRYRKFRGQRVEKTLVVFLAWVERDVRVMPQEHLGYEWVTWDPPHQMSSRIITRLLKRVEGYFREGANSNQ